MKLILGIATAALALTSFASIFHGVEGVKSNLQQNIKDLKSVNSVSTDDNKYKYVKNNGPEKHDNYTYYLGIGWNSLVYYIGADWYCSYNLSIYHKAGNALGKCLGASPLEWYFDSSGSWQWGSTYYTDSTKSVVYPHWPRFTKDFDKNMNADESRMFSSDSIMDQFCTSSKWVTAWENHQAIYIIYHTAYTDSLHSGMSGTIWRWGIATPEIYSSIFG